MKRLRVVAASGLLLLACSPNRTRVDVAPAASVPAPAPAPAEEPLNDAAARQVQNLAAFARVYGYVRFFHPSDEASEVDWTAMAVAGAALTRDAVDADALRAALERLFRPVAPTLRLYREGEPAPDLGRLPPAREGLSLVAWQHVGIGTLEGPTGGGGGVYTSQRIGRGSSEEGGIVAAAAEAAPMRGKPIRLRAALRSEAGAEGQLWIKVLREDGAPASEASTADRPVRSATWTTTELVHTIDADAAVVLFGGLARGDGAIFFDDFSLALAGRPLPLANAGFEDQLEGWEEATSDYAYALLRDAARGSQVLSMRPRGRLFDAAPALGDVVDAPIGRGLRVQVPLALSSLGGRTLGGAPEELARLQRLLAADRARRPLAYTELAHPDLRAADIVLAWTVLQHFYPYFDLIRADWGAELERALLASVTAPDAGAFVRALRRMVAALEDGHGYVHNPAYAAAQRGLPLRFEVVEGALVVVASSLPDVRRGDVLVRLNGEPAERLLERLTLEISGSPQHRRDQAARDASRGEKDAPAELVLRREGAEVTARTSYSHAGPPPAEPRRPEIERLPDGVFYVDLDRAPWEAIAARLPELARAPGVIFDLRGYPKGNHEILSHLLPAPETDKWMFTPQIILPDHAPPAGWDSAGWDLAPRAPRIAGKVAFLVGPGAISYAESILGYVEHYKLGELVGEASAGANGNINPFRLPSGSLVNWTGMRVTRHDGGQHHIRGVQPTVPAARTVAGVREGRDEVFERALEVVRSG